MKIYGEYVTRHIAGETLLVPVGRTILEHNGLLTLNACGSFLWDRLERAAKEEDLVEALLEEYDVDPDTAGRDVADFLARLRALGVLSSEEA